MKKIYLLYLLPIFLFACFPSRIDYIGSRNPSTQRVDVYVDEKAIPRSYTIIGKGYIQPNWRGKIPHEKMIARAILKAKDNGADAVFYRETFIPSPGASIHTQSHTDSLGKGVVTVSNTAMNQSYGYFRNELLFLKYK